jgi:hypothetical protein
MRACKSLSPSGDHFQIVGADLCPSFADGGFQLLELTLKTFIDFCPFEPRFSSKSAGPNGSASARSSRLRREAKNRRSRRDSRRSRSLSNDI